MKKDQDSLDQVYSATDSSATLKAYEGWAAQYDSENIGNGYRVPTIGCALFARHVVCKTDAILDAACGTGIVGEILNLLDYQHLVGSDLSPSMLELAKSTAAYNRLYQHDLAVSAPEGDNAYNAVICLGSLGPGHAPACCLDEFIRITRPEGHIIFNTRADTYAEQGLKEKVESLVTKGKWSLVEQSPTFRSYYLSDPEIHSQVFVFQVSP